MEVTEAYRILGVMENASNKMLKQARDNLVKKYNPKGTEPDDAKFRATVAAYEFLTRKPAGKPVGEPPGPSPDPEPPTVVEFTVEEMVKDNRAAAKIHEQQMVTALRSTDPKVIKPAVKKFVESLTTIKELPGPSHPFDVARVLYDSRFRHKLNGVGGVRFWRGDYYVWSVTHWQRIPKDEWENELYRMTRTAKIPVVVKIAGVPVALPEEEWPEWQPNRNNIGETYRAMQAVCTIPQVTEPPIWLSGAYKGADDRLTIPFANGLVVVTLDPLGTNLIGVSPDHFNTFVLPFAYDQDAPAPKTWLWFLNDEWGDDPDSIKLLQEWVGYVVTGRTDLHKIMLLTGPPRAGKGLIAKTLMALMGDNNCTGITLDAFGHQFGMASLVGKTLAVIGDARVGGKDTSAAVERLLSLSGQDKVQIQIKYHPDWVGRMPTRVMITSNETPALLDTSGAIVSRMLLLTMRHSHLGAEDTTLERRIMDELAGVMNWALEGAERLYRQGRFTVPPADFTLREEMSAMASPVEAFMTDRCELVPDAWTSTAALYQSWVMWCGENGEKPGPSAQFAHKLRTAAKGRIEPAKRRVAGRRVQGYRGIKLGKVASDERAI